MSADEAEPDDLDEPPLHRVVSRWATSTVCGALVAASAVTGASLLRADADLPRSATEVAGLWGSAALLALAVCAPLEAAAALIRRGSWCLVPLLFVVPMAIVGLVVIGGAWFAALASGGPEGALDRAAANLAATSVRLDVLAVVALLLGLLLVPLAGARAVAARAWVTCALAVLVPGPIAAWALVAEWLREPSPRHVQLLDAQVFVLLAVHLVGIAAGLCLGDRLEPILARRLRATLVDEP